MWAPIHIAYTSGANIIGNKITKVVPFGNGIFSFDPSFADFKYLSAGILCGTLFAQTGYPPGKIYREGAVTGPLNIKNNFIDLEADIPGKTLGQGIFLNWGTGVKAKISDNTMVNVSRNSIEVLDNYMANGIGMIVVEGNGLPLRNWDTLSGCYNAERDRLWLVAGPAGYDRTTMACTWFCITPSGSKERPPWGSWPWRMAPWS